MKEKLTVVFDDKCPTCTVGVNASAALDTDKTVEFVGMNTERGQAMVKEHNLDMNASAYAFRADGSRAEKAQMMRDVLAHNGIAGFFLSLPFRIPFFGDMLYEFLAWTRWHLTKSRK